MTVLRHEKHKAEKREIETLQPMCVHVITQKYSSSFSTQVFDLFKEYLKHKCFMTTITLFKTI